ncbi:glycoside hydrolase family 2 TIM barrel-domain containing protein [Kiritimatiellota bacterium B12222]|nr:glycoside hydrolase family 2 TIM barrel-domain containing protein [Kiritimatiellota bacterium B12222]
MCTFRIILLTFLFSLIHTSPLWAQGLGDAGPSLVVIEGDQEQGYRLMKNGQPFRIHGAGGSKYLDVLATNGGNAIRTWGVGPDTEDILNRAHAQGVSVTLGLWLGHERHGFDYGDAARLESQRAEVAAAVKKYRNHPALLTWGLGNEMEGIQNRGDHPQIWKEINYLAEMIKELDPHHPVMTVVANVNPDKVNAAITYAPALDILGVNSYAGAQNIGKNLKAFGWVKPYAITEYGLPGPWEVPHTAWDAPIEPTSREKAGFYFVSTKGILEDQQQCLGAYVFLWGSKQEATASWFGMFLPTGEKTPRVDATVRAWTGKWPANRAPILKEVNMPMSNQKVKGGQYIAVQARYADADGDALSYEWEVRRESTDRKVGGDEEAVPELVEHAVKVLDENGNALLSTPTQPGAYRLFVIIKDGKGSGCMDNWPFWIQ